MVQLSVENTVIFYRYWLLRVIAPYVPYIWGRFDTEDFRNMAYRNTAQLANVSGGTILSQEGKILLDYVYTALVPILHLV